MWDLSDANVARYCSAGMTLKNLLFLEKHCDERFFLKIDYSLTKTSEIQATNYRQNLKFCLNMPEKDLGKAI